MLWATEPEYRSLGAKVTELSYRSHAIPLFNLCNILPLNFRYCKSVCTIMHDVYNNCLPENISNVFLEPSQVHSYDIRFSETGRLCIKYSRTNQSKYSFSRFGARIWNSIPQRIRILPKHKCKSFFASVSFTYFGIGGYLCWHTYFNE